MTTHVPSVEPRIAALVVTYFPDDTLPSRLELLLEQVSRVVIVDNGSSEASLRPLAPYRGRADVTLHCNRDNIGIAAALNQGLAILADEDFEWVITLDQDSEVTAGFVAGLVSTLQQDRDPTPIAMIGANRLDKGIDGSHRWLRPRSRFPWFERVPCEQLTPDGTTHVITSGTLTSLAAFRAIGPFLEKLFIDLVDIEYCLRARRAGYRILVSCEARLTHQVGSKRRHRWMGLSFGPTHHVPVRRYYLFRNSVRLLKDYGGAYPHWCIYHLLALAEIIAGVVLFEREKLAKLRACLQGLWDGLRGKAGPAPSL